MGVYIKGMEMPTGCGECRFVQKGSQEFCGLLLPDFKYSENWSIRPDHCPLIELPPHGDLIDRDEQIERAWRLTQLLPVTRELIETMLKTAPTILEAEVGET